METEIILRIKPFKMIGYFVGSLIFVIGGCWMILEGEWMGWLSVGFFGVGTIIFLVQIVPSCSYLHLNQTGFTVCSLFCKHTYQWTDIKEFKMVNFNCGYSTKKLVGIEFALQMKGKDNFLAKSSQFLAECDGCLPDTYGYTPQGLSNLLNDWRLKYIS